MPCRVGIAHSYYSLRERCISKKYWHYVCEENTVQKSVLSGFVYGQWAAFCFIQQKQTALSL